MWWRWCAVFRPKRGAWLVSVEVAIISTAGIFKRDSAERDNIPIRAGLAMIVIAHWYLIWLGNMVLATYKGFEPVQVMTFFFFFPRDCGLSLPGVYLIWLLVLAILYPFCKRFASIKTRRMDWWLSYLQAGTGNLVPGTGRTFLQASRLLRTLPRASPGYQA